tara:strand:- start:1835 stop:2515 length:681 start_codon:yes stop_codon:yes gene_type:complete
MAQARGLENFMRAVGNSGGVSASNLYQFSIQPSDKLIKFFSDNVDQEFLEMVDNVGEMNLQLLCNEIQLPGVTYSAFDIKSVHKGITQKMATAKVYNELDVSFFLDGTSMPLRFFRAWQDFTSNTVASAPENFYDDKEYKRSSAFNYYDDYACDMFINKLEKYDGKIAGVKDDNGNPKKDTYANPWNVRLVKAYPYTVASIPYSSAAAQLVKVTVGFYYEYSHLII